MKEIGTVKYKVDGTVVQIWEINAAEDALPFLHQPFDPVTMKAFASVDEAEQWAEEYITKTYL